MPKHMTLNELIQAHREAVGEEASRAKTQALLDLADEMASEVAESLGVDADWPRLDVDTKFPNVVIVGFYPRAKGQPVPPQIERCDPLNWGAWEPLELEETAA